MNTLKMIFVAIVTGLAILAMAGNAVAVDFTDAQRDKLKAGKSVKKPLAEAGSNGVYGGAGFALVDAPPDVVWSAILDWGSYKRIFPKMIEVREVSRKGGRRLVRMEIGHKLINVSYFVSVETDKAKWQVSYELVGSKPHDLDEVQGYWRLFPQKNGQTLVAYVTAVKVPMGVVNLIPDALEEKINRNLLASPQFLREWIHRAGPTRYASAR
jgi:hypothetical protein